MTKEQAIGKLQKENEQLRTEVNRLKEENELAKNSELNSESNSEGKSEV